MQKLFRDKGYCVSDLKVLTVSCPTTREEKFNGFLLTIPVPLQILFSTSCNLEEIFGNKEM